MFETYRPEDRGNVDREIRIERMKRELEEIAGGPVVSGGYGDVPPTLEEAFLARALEFEKADFSTIFSRLTQRGVVLEPPDELDNIAVSEKLHEVVNALAEMNCFVYDTGHLSDREFYGWLWIDGLREETPDVSLLGGAWHTSPIGSGSEEDCVIYLKYYATEDQRRQWQEEFPDDPLPSHETLPYDRDRKLPRGNHL